MNHKRFFTLVILGLIALLMLAACTVPDLPGANDEATPEQDAGVTVTFVHALRDNNAVVVDELVQRFNESHEGITVEAHSTGSYAETLATALKGGRLAKRITLAHIYDMGLQTMVDSGETLPIDALNQGDMNLDEMIWPVKNYYSVNDSLACMPFNSSTAVLYYNKEMLEDAGLDPDSPPTTWADVDEYSRKIVERDIAPAGISMAWPTWAFEQSYAMHDQPFANNGNGRRKLATEVNVSPKFGVRFGYDLLQLWRTMAKDGLLVYYGRTYDATTPFINGDFPFLIQSTSHMPTILGQTTFEVGVAPLPRLSGYDWIGNNFVSGGCIWVMNSASPEEQAAAGEFLQFIFAPEQSASWHKRTGYLPINQQAIETLTEEGWFDEQPNYAVGLDHLLSGRDTPEGTGPLFGNYPEVRARTGLAIEEVLFGDLDPTWVLEVASEEIRILLATYAGIPENEIPPLYVENEPGASAAGGVVTSEQAATLLQGADDSANIRLWYHGSGNEVEREVLVNIIGDFNSSQGEYFVELQDFPEASYSESVATAALDGKLPDILDVDAPAMPNWVWSGYLAPLDLPAEAVDGFLPGTVGKWDGELYSVGLLDAANAIYARKSVLDANDIRIPKVGNPWTLEEFDEALETLQASGEFDYALDLGMSQTGEWYPYAFSPFLASFGGDIIDRDTFLTAEGALNGDEAIAFGEWWQSLFERELVPDTFQEAVDREIGFVNGKYALQWNGNWAAASALEAFGDDLLFLPAPDFGNGPKIGAGSWQFGISVDSERQEGANAFLTFALQDAQMATYSDGFGLIPATASAAALTDNYGEGGKLEPFFELSNQQGLIRPPTPAYLEAALVFEQAIAALAQGADVKETLDDAAAKIDADIAANDGYGFGE